jgi:hypothetical protein
MVYENYAVQKLLEEIQDRFDLGCIKGYGHWGSLPAFYNKKVFELTPYERGFVFGYILKQEEAKNE